MDKIRVILASNHELWWEGLVLLLKKSSDIEMLDICYDGTTVLDKVIRLKPDVLLIDEEMKSGDSIDVVQKISKLNPNTKVIIVINPYKHFSISANFESLAKAYIDKDLTYPELISCIHHVVKGGMVVIISPVVAQQILDEVTRNESNVRVEYDVGLSKREKEILIMLSRRGTTNKEIAEALFITENTVKAHLSKIMEKMQVRNRQQAAILAREKGILSQGSIS